MVDGKDVGGVAVGKGVAAVMDLFYCCTDIAALVPSSYVGCTVVGRQTVSAADAVAAAGAGTSSAAVTLRLSLWF